MKIGLQLYSVNEEQNSDFAGALKKVREIGYEGIELCGFADKTPEEVKKIAADNGLEIISAHVGLPNEDNADIAKIVDEYARAGVKKIIIPWMGFEQWFPRCRYDLVFSRINRYYEEAKKCGIRAGFHNHYMEFVSIFGKEIMGHIFDRTPDDFIMEVDTAWAQFATGDALGAIKRYAPKTTDLCHFKGLLENGKSKGCRVGEGCVDFAGIVSFLKESNASWAIVEEEKADIPPFEAAKISFENIKKII